MPSRSLVLACCALAVSVGAYGDDAAHAAASLITGSQIAQETIGSANIQNRSLTADDAEGVTGPKGPKGAAGRTGDRGVTGDRGRRGHQGVRGEAGSTGETGNPGATGGDGPKGPLGDTGPQGAAGTNGVGTVSVYTGYHEFEAGYGVNYWGMYCPGAHQRAVGGGLSAPGGAIDVLRSEAHRNVDSVTGREWEFAADSHERANRADTYIVCADAVD